jgi:hypothetical protein
MTAEARLKRYPRMTNQPIVIHNLRYWGLPRNDGFVLIPNEVITIDINSTRQFKYKDQRTAMLSRVF